MHTAQNSNSAVEKAVSAKSKLLPKEPFRGYLIFLSIMLMFGNNYAFDIPQALETPIEKRLHISQVEFNLLYSIFALPNIGLSIGGGIMIDKIGGRWGLFTFGFLMSLSQVAIAIGGSYSEFYMMLVGRAMFGVASDMLFISISKVLSQHLQADFGLQSQALGLVLTIPELAAALNSFLSPLLFQESGSLTLPLIFGLTICLLSFGCGIGVIYIDIIMEQQKALNSPPPLSIEDEIKQLQLENHDGEVPKIKLNQGFILLMLICTFSISVYTPFLDNVNKFYQERFGWTQIKSGRIVMIGYIVSALTSPLIGRLSDKWKSKRKPLILLTTLLFLASHLQFFLLKQGTQQIPNYFSIFGQVAMPFHIQSSYIGTSLLVLLISADSLFVDHAAGIVFRQMCTFLMIATALGILGVGENIFLSAIPILTAWVYGELDKERRLQAVDMIYLSMATISVLLAVKILFSKHLQEQEQDDEQAKMGYRHLKSEVC